MGLVFSYFYKKPNSEELRIKYLNSDLNGQKEIMDQYLKENTDSKTFLMMTGINDKILHLYNLCKGKVTQNIMFVEKVNLVNILFLKMDQLSCEEKSEEKSEIINKIFDILGEAQGGRSATDSIIANSYEEDCFLMQHRSNDLIRLNWVYGDDWIVLYYSINNNSFVGKFNN